MGAIGLIIAMLLLATLGVMPYLLGQRLAQAMGESHDGQLGSVLGWALVLLVWGSFVWMKWLGPAMQQRRLRRRLVKPEGPEPVSGVLWDLSTGGALWLPWTFVVVVMVIVFCALGPPEDPGNRDPWDDLFK
ncbi:hypothetical protein GA0070561_1453 [Micromonospora saelicesensis]|uniref:Uncharacterized protein n=1 Tax=Micromonospora saelicesensis TaxID=285676 RepID=A0A1C4UXE2_9ACTN|nr:hypothetical protein GA0070561_1453 [Micromonospora saelicesensis]